MNTASNKIPIATSTGAYPWVPDCGDGTYRNPVLHADYSDPDVIRHGDDFWMVASSFNCTPGLPILHSRDLINWSLVNHALKNVPGDRYNEVQPGCGVWAPSIRFHVGKFHIVFPSPDEGIYVVTADDPRGPWSAPHLMQAGKGLIDPCPFWDDDGKAYLVHAYAGSRAGIKHRLRVRPMSPDAATLLGEGEIVFHEPERHHTIEGPKFLKRNGWYYIFAPAGGVETGWQVVLRSRHIYGPYEDRIVLAQGKTTVNGPHQGAIVDTPSGEWWFVHFQDVGAYGRVMHLQPVEWRNDWPVMGNAGEPVLHHRKPNLPTARVCQPATNDEFNANELGLQWQWYANHRDGWCSLATRKNWLRLLPQLTAQKNLARVPNLLLQKLPARSFAAETLLEFSPVQPGEEAGLIIVGESFGSLALTKADSGNEIIFRTGESSQNIPVGATNLVRLRVTVGEGGRCQFSFASASDWVSVGEPFSACKGVWIGAKVGLYSIKRQNRGESGVADFNYFRFT